MRLKYNNSSGMTLIEILIVVALLGILATVMIRSLGSSFEDGKLNLARVFTGETAPQLIQRYYLKKHDYPSSWENLVQAEVVDSVPLDPWKQAYLIQPSSRFLIKGRAGTNLSARGVFIFSKCGQASVDIASTLGRIQPTDSAAEIMKKCHQAEQQCKIALEFISI